MSGSVSIFKKMLCNFGGFHSLFYKKGPGTLSTLS